MAVLEGFNIARTQKQHSSVVVVIPVHVRVCLGIKAGDYVIFSSHPGVGVVEFQKLQYKEVIHGRDKVHTNRKDTDGSTFAKD